MLGGSELSWLPGGLKSCRLATWYVAFEPAKQKQHLPKHVLLKNFRQHLKIPPWQQLAMRSNLCEMVDELKWNEWSQREGFNQLRNLFIT